MKNNELVELYNQYLSIDLQEFKIESWIQLRQFGLSDLQKLIDFFAYLLTDIGLDEDGEVTTKGALIDDIIGKINMTMISMKES